MEKSVLLMLKKVLLSLVKGYQRFISPLFPPSCRYYPSCSNYTVQAIEKHGGIKGGIMGLSRILRCNPFVRGGVDHVPDHFSLRRNPDDQGSMFSQSKKLDAELDELLETYKDLVVIREQLPTSEEVIKELVSIKEQPLEKLPEGYQDIAYETIIENEPEIEEVTLQFFEVINDEKSQPYRAHLHHEEISKALDGVPEDKKLGIVVEKNSGLWDTNSPELARDFYLKRGITKEDIEEKTEVLERYLYVLKEKEAEHPAPH